MEFENSRTVALRFIAIVYYSDNSIIYFVNQKIFITALIFRAHVRLLYAYKYQFTCYQYFDFTFRFKET